jgi:glycosyltransferase involved in cell wall biosynthesis
MNPKISVIIPAYNSERYLEKCLDSIFNQTFQDFEVILVNDGSTDSTRLIGERYASARSNMILVSQENRGLSCARNTGLDVCHGEYVAFCDSDDYVEPDWLQCYMETISEDRVCDMVVQGLIIDCDNRAEFVSFPKKTYEGKDIISAFLILKSRSIDGFMHNKIYKRCVIEDNHLRFELKLKEDLLFNLKCLSQISSISIIPSCCYHYVQHDRDSLIHRRYPADFMHTLLIALRNAAFVLADKYDDTRFKSYALEDFMLAYSVLLFSMYNKVNGINDRDKRLEYIREYQQIRKDHCNIKIRMGNKAKRLFARFMMLPPMIADMLMRMLDF